MNIFISLHSFHHKNRTISQPIAAFPQDNCLLVSLSDIKLGVDLLPLHIERSHLRWFWHLIRKSPGPFPASNLEEILKGLHAHLAWECLMTPQKELEDFTVETYVWATLFSLQPQQPPA